MIKVILLSYLIFISTAQAAPSSLLSNEELKSFSDISNKLKTTIKKIKQKEESQKRKLATDKTKSVKRKKFRFTPIGERPKFDIPVTYNAKVKKWISYFQNRGKNWFHSRLGRSHTYIPMMERILEKRKLPKELTYLAMIESGFSAKATSHAQAVGYWQFIKPTANRYGLRTNWWIDERQDFEKSTLAATAYLSDLHKMFGSWYLTASAYNMGETRLRRLIKKYRTKNFWVLSQFKDFPKETREYIPKLIATMLIAKNPKLYGFHNIKPKKPYSFSTVYIPGGTDLINLSDRFGIKSSQLLKLNPELKRAYIPKGIRQHRIRVPKAKHAQISQHYKVL